jgi:hypothetical protein
MMKRCCPSQYLLCSVVSWHVCCEDTAGLPASPDAGSTDAAMG